jgi:hypothetical protein
MASKRKINRTSAQRRATPGLAADFADFLHSLARTLFDPYRPELYYMRGPGPKWHAKHAGPSDMPLGAMPAMVRIKAR